ncbi:Protein Skeletor, isoforms D/E [Hypsibius exemplaris]|uniref:Protein Skeletor, isoforms D/E n=1 Tax=Hypsibius exemplaris TaxID=2072580 RepID=A0A1W0XB15_HYPEX|nr:Protein Skeletor, isoforms D/E [Hypsibius exemplaris]
MNVNRNLNMDGRNNQNQNGNFPTQLRFVQSSADSAPGATNPRGGPINNDWTWAGLNNAGNGGNGAQGVSSFFPTGGPMAAFGATGNGQGQQQQQQSAALLQNDIGTPYFGTPIGRLNSYQHGLAGDVFAVDDETVLVKRFVFDGQVPDAFFYVGSTDSVAARPFNAVILNNDKGQRVPLTRSDGQDVVVRLNSGANLGAYRWLAVISNSQNANFGDVLFPRDFSPPTVVSLGPLMPAPSNFLAGSVRSGTVTVINDKQIQIQNFHYDGQAPDAVFWTGQGAQPSSQGTIVPFQNSYTKLPPINGQTFTLTLPANFNVMNVNWLAVWSRQLNLNLGYVMIPGGLNVPPTLAGSAQSSPPTASLMDLPNCEVLGNGAMQVRWSLQGQDLFVQMKGRIADSQYMAFGISGMQNRVAMIGSDVTVARWDPESGSVSAQDYTLSSRQECDGTNGVCPDAEIRGGESIQVLGGTKTDGVLSVSFRRRINTGDRLDLVINPNSDTFVVWAIGPLNERGQPSKHYQNQHATVQQNERLRFGRMQVDNCPVDFGRGAMPPGAVVVQGFPSGSTTQTARPSSWRQQYILGNETSTFIAVIGPSGGRKGYSGITGKPTWGLVWYLNGKLAPELILRRGYPYRFIVYGGMYPQALAKYHPLYITSDSSGGLGGKYPVDQAKEVVLGGVSRTNTGAFVPVAAGQYCAFAQPSTSDPDTFTSFEEYNRTLTLRCDGGQPGALPGPDGAAGVLEWTPGPNDPSTLYYQCFMHKDMGWKITLVNDYRETDAMPGLRQQNQQLTLRPTAANNGRPSGFYPASNNQRSGCSRTAIAEASASLVLFLFAFLLRH